MNWETYNTLTVKQKEEWNYKHRDRCNNTDIVFSLIRNSMYYFMTVLVLIACCAILIIKNIYVDETRTLLQFIALLTAAMYFLVIGIIIIYTFKLLNDLWEIWKFYRTYKVKTINLWTKLIKKIWG